MTTETVKTKPIVINQTSRERFTSTNSKSFGEKLKKYLGNGLGVLAGVGLVGVAGLAGAESLGMFDKREDSDGINGLTTDELDGMYVGLTHIDNVLFDSNISWDQKWDYLVDPQAFRDYWIDQNEIRSPLTQDEKTSYETYLEGQRAAVVDVYGEDEGNRIIDTAKKEYYGDINGNGVNSFDEFREGANPLFNQQELLAKIASQSDKVIDPTTIENALNAVNSGKINVDSDGDGEYDVLDSTPLLHNSYLNEDGSYKDSDDDGTSDFDRDRIIQSLSDRKDAESQFATQAQLTEFDKAINEKNIESDVDGDNILDKDEKKGEMFVNNTTYLNEDGTYKDSDDDGTSDFDRDRIIQSLSDRKDAESQFATQAQLTEFDKAIKEKNIESDVDSDNILDKDEKKGELFIDNNFIDENGQLIDEDLNGIDDYIQDRLIQEAGVNSFKEIYSISSSGIQARLQEQTDLNWGLSGIETISGFINEWVDKVFDDIAKSPEEILELYSGRLESEWTDGIGHKVAEAIKNNPNISVGDIRGIKEEYISEEIRSIQSMGLKTYMQSK